MPKTLSKRALEGRRWRIQARQKRKLNTIISKYVEEKYKNIYYECTTFYNSVVDKYLETQNLTKTREFQYLLETKDVSEQDGTNQGETAAVVDEQTGTDKNETAVVDEQTGTDENETAVVDEQTGNGQNETAAVVDEQTGAVTLTPGNTYVEPGVIINEYIVNNNVDIINEAMSGPVGDNDEGIDRLADMDTIINNIITDLEGVEPSIFQDLNDEGIGLNTEDEFGNMLEVDDYDLW